MSNRNINRQVNSKAKKVAKNFVKLHPVLSIILVFIIIAVIVGGYFVYNKYIKDSEDVFIEVDGELSFHFMMLGNDKSGDSIFIKAGDNDILIDAGSTSDSADDIINYVNNYCTDGILEYVIVTHADYDHIACFGCSGGIFDEYKCKTIIDFPNTEKSTVTYNEYISKRNNEKLNDGAVIYNALDCYNNTNGGSRVYNLTDTVKMEILYNYYYDHDADSENNYSVCVMFRHGDRQFLFTGDLEKEGEAKLIEKYPNLGTVELFKAGHHGSATSSSEMLLKEIKPKICVVSCGTGGQYNFPTQAFIDRISKYTEKVYVTTLADEDFVEKDSYEPLNGNVIVISNDNGVSVSCSNNNTLLKDTEWFKQERTTPQSWLN